MRRIRHTVEIVWEYHTDGMEAADRIHSGIDRNLIAVVDRNLVAVIDRNLAAVIDRSHLAPTGHKAVGHHLAKRILLELDRKKQVVHQ